MQVPHERPGCKCSGTVTWSAGLNYADKNFDDDYDWRYDVAVFAFNSGGFILRSDGPFEDNWGRDDKSFSQQLQ
jgi:hypothetical protein